MNTEKAVSLKKKYAVTAVFVSAVLLLGVVCYTVAFAANNKATVYALLPKYGVVSKNCGGENFYFTDNAERFNGDGYKMKYFYAYYNESDGLLETAFCLEYTKNDDGLISEYGESGGFADIDKMRAETLSGKVISASALINTWETRKKTDAHPSQEFDEIEFIGKFKFDGDDKTVKISTKNTSFCFTLQPKPGVFDIKMLGETADIGNGVSIIKAKGEFLGEEGCYFATVTDESVFSKGSLTGPSPCELKFFDSNKNDITEKFDGNNACNGSDGDFWLNAGNGSPRFYKALSGASFDDICAVEARVEGAFYTPEKFIKLSQDKSDGMYTVFGGLCIGIENVRVEYDGFVGKECIKFSAFYSGEAGQSLGFKNPVLYYADEKGNRSEVYYNAKDEFWRISGGNAELYSKESGKKEYMIPVSDGKKPSGFIGATVSLEYTAFGNFK